MLHFLVSGLEEAAPLNGRAFSWFITVRFLPAGTSQIKNVCYT